MMYHVVAKICLYRYEVKKPFRLKDIPLLIPIKARLANGCHSYLW